MSPALVKILFERYGTRAEQICDHIAKGADAPLETLPDYTRREIAFLGSIEKAPHLDDLVLRRTMLGMLGEITRERLDELGEVLGETHGWSNARRREEVARTRELLANVHGIML
jgi:glycerol-3-phosphate dehydrogenase